MFKENKIRTGYTNFNKGMFFMVPEHYKKYTKKVNNIKYVRVSNSCWFTSLPVRKHQETLTLYRKYDEKKFPKYVNYNAINVDTWRDIPSDYDGEIGVPITFLDKYNPEQFEILGIDRVLVEEATGKVSRFKIDGQEIYARVIIKNKRI